MAHGMVMGLGEVVLQLISHFSCHVKIGEECSLTFLRTIKTWKEWTGTCRQWNSCKII